MSPDYDVIVIGSGFGGSVTALRLSEKGYRVAVLEQGARWRPEDYPPDNVPMRKTLWQPYFGLTGPLRITVLKNVAIQSAVGVGGGSLVYGNVLYEPLEQFYNDPQWASITDWKAELAPYYDQAKRMLGVATNPRLTAADECSRRLQTIWVLPTRFTRPRWARSSASPARRCPTRTSVASDQTALAASSVGAA